MPLSHNMTRNLYQESKHGLTSSTKFSKLIVFFLFLTFIKCFFSILYWWARYFAPSHLPTGLFPLCLIALKMTQDSSVNFSSVRVIFHATGVVPLVPTRSSPTQFTSRSLCSGAPMNTVRGLDYIAVTAVSHDTSPLCHADNCSHSNHTVTTLLY